VQKLENTNIVISYYLTTELSIAVGHKGL